MTSGASEVHGGADGGFLHSIPRQPPPGKPAVARGARRSSWPQGPVDILLLSAVLLLGALWTWRAHSSHHHVLVRQVGTRGRHVGWGREVKAGAPCSSGAGRRGFDPRQLLRTRRAFFPPLAI